MARTLAGQRQAFGVLVERHQDRLLSYVRYMGFGEADSLDLAQDAFVRAYRHLDRCGDPDRFAGWLFKIVSNVCRSAGRRSARHPTESLDSHCTTLASDLPGPDQDADANWARERVRAALGTLPADQREALVLMYLQGHSVKEIEELTGASRPAVKMRLKRGREALKGELEPFFTEAMGDE